MVRKIRLILTYLATLALALPLVFSNITDHFEAKKSTLSHAEFQLTDKGHNTKDFEARSIVAGLIARADNSDEEITENDILSLYNEPSSDVHPHIFSEYLHFGGTTVKFEMFVDLYSKDSFRQINRYNHGFLSIDSYITPTRIENSFFDAWSPTGYPSTTLFYSFSATLLAQVWSNDDDAITKELLDHGFLPTGESNRMTYYRLPINASGTIELYPAP